MDGIVNFDAVNTSMGQSNNPATRSPSFSGTSAKDQDPPAFGSADPFSRGLGFDSALPKHLFGTVGRRTSLALSRRSSTDFSQLNPDGTLRSQSPGGPPGGAPGRFSNGAIGSEWIPPSGSALRNDSIAHPAPGSGFQPTHSSRPSLSGRAPSTTSFGSSKGEHGPVIMGAKDMAGVGWTAPDSWAVKADDVADDDSSESSQRDDETDDMLESDGSPATGESGKFAAHDDPAPAAASMAAQQASGPGSALGASTHSRGAANRLGRPITATGTHAPRNVRANALTT